MNDLVVWQAAMDAKEIPTPAPAMKSMKPNESIWKPGDYLLEVELMKYSLENRHVSFYLHSNFFKNRLTILWVADSSLVILSDPAADQASEQPVINNYP